MENPGSPDAQPRILVANDAPTTRPPADPPVDRLAADLTACLASGLLASAEASDRLRLAHSVFEHSREGIAITGLDGLITDVNEAFTRITGYTREEALGHNPNILSSGRQSKAFYTAMWQTLNREGSWSGEVWNRRKDGEVYAELLSIHTVTDGQGRPRHYMALFSDITATKEHQSQLEHMAHFDALTNLPNRVLLGDRLQQSLTLAHRRTSLLAVACIDLDSFKSINDAHGHPVGDQVLLELSKRMKRVLREGDTLARLGSDEFVAVLLDLPDAHAAAPTLNRLLAVTSQPVVCDNTSIRVSGSVGVTFYPQLDDVDADQLLRQADRAMYQAKLAGKNRYHVFDEAQDRSVRGLHESLERMRAALSAHEFELHYQPKVNMRTGEIKGAEALIRWRHPQHGLLMPSVFLPAMEDHPLSIAVGEWVISTALAQVASWLAAGLHMPVSVNVGAFHLQSDNFMERLTLILAAHPHTPPAMLELELLETSALNDLARTSRLIESCRRLGVNFSLDDFGTGYSSLTYLKRLPVAQLKIDQSFVRDMLDDPDDLAILEGIIGLASAFGRQVIAEGVETLEHGVLLLQLGCDLAQGFGVANPMPSHELLAWSQAWRPHPSWARTTPLDREERALLVAKVQHRAWTLALTQHLSEGGASPQPLSDTQCHLGQWLHTSGRARHGSHPNFHAVCDMHHRLHAMADQAWERHTQGAHARAQACLQTVQTLSQTLAEHIQALTQPMPEAGSPPG